MTPEVATNLSRSLQAPLDESGYTFSINAAAPMRMHIEVEDGRPSSVTLERLQIEKPGYKVANDGPTTFDRCVLESLPEVLSSRLAQVLSERAFDDSEFVLPRLKSLLEDYERDAGSCPIAIYHAPSRVASKPIFPGDGTFTIYEEPPRTTSLLEYIHDREIQKHTLTRNIAHDQDEEGIPLAQMDIEIPRPLTVDSFAARIHLTSFEDGIVPVEVQLPAAYSTPLENLEELDTLLDLFASDDVAQFGLLLSDMGIPMPAELCASGALGEMCRYQLYEEMSGHHLLVRLQDKKLVQFYFRSVIELRADRERIREILSTLSQEYEGERQDKAAAELFDLAESINGLHFDDIYHFDVRDLYQLIQERGFGDNLDLQRRVREEKFQQFVDAIYSLDNALCRVLKNNFYQPETIYLSLDPYFRGTLSFFSLMGENTYALTGGRGEADSTRRRDFLCDVLCRAGRDSFDALQKAHMPPISSLVDEPGVVSQPLFRLSPHFKNVHEEYYKKIASYYDIIRGATNLTPDQIARFAEIRFDEKSSDLFSLCFYKTSESIGYLTFSRKGLGKEFASAASVRFRFRNNDFINRFFRNPYTEYTWNFNGGFSPTSFRQFVNNLYGESEFPPAIYSIEVLRARNPFGPLLVGSIELAPKKRVPGINLKQKEE